MIVALLLAFALPAPPPSIPATSEPSAEALALGQQIAESGVLASLLPLMAQQETAALIAANSGLPVDQQSRLRATAEAVASAGQARVIAAEAQAYAAALSIDDLRTLAAHAQSEAALHARAAMPAIIAGTMQTVGAIDFKGEVRQHFCAGSTDCALNP